MLVVLPIIAKGMLSWGKKEKKVGLNNGSQTKYVETYSYFFIFDSVQIILVAVTFGNFKNCNSIFIKFT